MSCSHTITPRMILKIQLYPQESGSVTSDDDDAASAENILESTITVTPTEDTTYTCSITDPNGDAAVQKTVTLNVFGLFVCL